MAEKVLRGACNLALGHLATCVAISAFTYPLTVANRGIAVISVLVVLVRIFTLNNEFSAGRVKGERSG